MKKLPIAAAALLFGTSAFAMIPSTEPSGVAVQKDPYTVEPTTAADPAYDEAPALQPAAVDTWTAAEPVAYMAEADEAEFKTVAATSDDVKADETDAHLAAVHETDATADAADEAPVLEPAVAELEPAAYETTAVDEEPTPVEEGVGGPYEGVDTAAADLAPRAAAQNYPACQPGPGDDRCIQLYEPGVRQQLASWTQPTGGFAGAGETQVAMGGPYEPVDSATETERLNQQALADSARAVQVADAAAVTTDEPVDDSAIETARADNAAMMNGDGRVETALSETADDEDLIEV